MENDGAGLRLPADLRGILEEKISLGQTLITQLASPR
jgi:hypothetical protein